MASKGIIVKLKENGIQIAISESNFNKKLHEKVRDLKPGESVRTYAPRKPEPLSEAVRSTEPQGPKPGSEDK
jgi:hypothetical protein